MKNILSCKIMIAVACLLGLSANAHAHLGHVGDLAGHSHWVGIGAVVATGALLWALGKKPKQGEEDDGQEASAEAGAEAEAESA